MPSPPLPLGSFRSLPYGSPVPRVAGKIEKLYPSKVGPNYRLQNGSLLDEATGAEVEFMLNKREEWPVEQFRGGWVEFSGEGLKWCEQFDKKSGATLGKGKIEIQTEAQVVKRLAKGDYRGPAAAAGELTLFPSPRGGAPEPAGREDCPRARLDRVQAELAKLGGLHALCVAEAVRQRDLHGEKANGWTTFLGDTTATLFIQATRDGLHHGIDPTEVEASASPEAAARLRPSLTKLEAMVVGREDKVNRLLQLTGIIAAEQTWRDLSEAAASDAMEKGVFQLVMSA